MSVLGWIAIVLLTIFSVYAAVIIISAIMDRVERRRRKNEYRER